MSETITRLGAVFAAAALALSAAGCSAEEVTELAPEDATVSFGPQGEDGSFVLPLPTEEAKSEFIVIAGKSAQRFYELGLVETYVYEGGEDTFIYDPNYELGPAAAVVFENEEGDGYGVDWVYNFAPFSPFMAIDLVRQEDTEIVDYNVTRLDDNTYVVADTQIGSRTYYVQDNVIVGWNVIDNDRKTIGRSYITYLIGQEEKVILDTLVEGSSQEDLDLIFNQQQEEVPSE